MAKTMAEEIDRINYERQMDLSASHVKALAAALSAAGYGLVADAKREAWDEGFTACAYEHMAQDRDPSHPITRTNPYRKASNDDQ